jgi:cytochrome oxidase Cu insertion factor (SCO1/SenC/PrrC family)
LPDVVVYDEDGREFSLTELRGEYAVLVFGCLT